jgi:hypothetical protein
MLQVHIFWWGFLPLAITLSDMVFHCCQEVGCTRLTGARQVSTGWPEQGYGSHLSLHIYVYKLNEMEALKELLNGCCVHKDA